MENPSQTNVAQRSDSDVATSDLLGLPSKYWEAPFRYDVNGSCILDKKGAMIVDIRGYGYLTGKGSLGLSDRHACYVQDQLGEAIARLVNAAWPNVQGQTRSANIQNEKSGEKL
jgi:hypothetical protein